MKYLINIKILSLVISFICTLSVSSWERGSAAMTWPLNKEIKKRGRQEEKTLQRTTLHTYKQSCFPWYPGAEQDSQIRETLFSPLLPFPSCSTSTDPLQSRDFWPWERRGLKGWHPSCPIPVHPSHGTGRTAQPALPGFFSLRAGSKLWTLPSTRVLARWCI